MTFIEGGLAGVHQAGYGVLVVVNGEAVDDEVDVSLMGLMGLMGPIGLIGLIGPIGPIAQIIVNALEVGDVDLVNSVPVDEIDYIESLGYMINTQPGRYARRMPQGAKSQIYRVFTGPLSS